ncbi:MAG: nitrogen regulation protein NR(I), partial [Proteobacteria bacterium]|nr:nitrogen regulation protein NR(I) [Pseudomonadota bacterium]
RSESEGMPSKSFVPEAMERLKDYRWPGNVRELENLVQRLTALYSQDVISLETVEAELAHSSPGTSAEARADEESLSDAIERHLRTYFSAHRDGLPAAGLYGRILHEMERPLIGLSLEATRGNQVQAASLLGLNRNTLRKKIRELDIDVVRGVK